ncbi:MAG: nucleotide exchange factor GrpE [Propionibacteriaceae bacterium]|nr:nucleotide exchange factor GrpE [Propionibacteriaceae bacterium]
MSDDTTTGPEPDDTSGDDTPKISDDDLAQLIASVNEAAAKAGVDADVHAVTAPDESAPMTDEQRLAQAETALAERTDDLQRLQAEYVNYKRRVDRDRELARQRGAESVVRELVPVLDAMHHAQEADEELPEGMRLVVAEMVRLAGKLGLETFGAPGDEFDPTAHEALYQVPTSEYAPETVATVVQPGYRLNGVVLRPARVAVATEVPE